MTASPPAAPRMPATRAENAQVGLPSEEEAIAAYNAVWQSAPGIDAHNVEIVRREAMAAVFSLIRPAFEAKDAEIEAAKEFGMGFYADCVSEATRELYRSRARARSASAAARGETR